jgi:hypothetical protein
VILHQFDEIEADGKPWRFCEGSCYTQVALRPVGTSYTDHMRVPVLSWPLSLCADVTLIKSKGGACTLRAHERVKNYGCGQPCGCGHE